VHKFSHFVEFLLAPKQVQKFGFETKNGLQNVSISVSINFSKMFDFVQLKS
jgi:hypothetical protein